MIWLLCALARGGAEVLPEPAGAAEALMAAADKHRKLLAAERSAARATLESCRGHAAAASQRAFVASKAAADTSDLFERHKLRLAAEGRYVGAQTCQNPEVGGLQPLASSTSFDLTLRRIFQFGRGAALDRIDTSLAVRNVTDRAVFDQCGLPQPGRLVQVQFRIR